MQYINPCISKVLEQWGGGLELYFQQSMIKTESVLPAKHDQNRVAESQSEFVRHAWLQETSMERHKETQTDIDCSNLLKPGGSLLFSRTPPPPSDPSTAV